MSIVGIAATRALEDCRIRVVETHTAITTAASFLEGANMMMLKISLIHLLLLCHHSSCYFSILRTFDAKEFVTGCLVAASVVSMSNHRCW